MKTATEISLRNAMARAALKPIMRSIRNEMDEIMEKTLYRMFSREVSAKRARKLRKRGIAVRFHKFTSTGKARYTWLPFYTLIEVK